MNCAGKQVSAENTKTKPQPSSLNMGLDPNNLPAHLTSKIVDAPVRVPAPEPKKKVWRPEKKEQEDFRNLLNQAKGRGELTFNQFRMDKAPTGTIGWPDFTVALY